MINVQYAVWQIISENLVGKWLDDDLELHVMLLNNS